MPNRIRSFIAASVVGVSLGPLAAAQQGVARTMQAPAGVARPAGPMDRSLGSFQERRADVRPFGTWDGAQQAVIGRTTQDPSPPPRPEMQRRWSGRGNCALGLCNRGFVQGLSYGYPVSVPDVVVYRGPPNDDNTVYGATYVRRPSEPEPPAVPVAPGHAKMIVFATGNEVAGGRLVVHETGNGRLRLEWAPNAQGDADVQLFLADSAQRTLQSVLAVAGASSALFDTRALSAPVAFAGVTIVMAHGTVLTTLVPYRGARPRVRHLPRR